MIVEVDRDAGEFRKRAETPEEADRLRQEARVLQVARHPGAVQLLGVNGDTLRLALVDGERVCDRAPGPDETARIAAAAATTLADLHEIGVVHGAISGEHILVDRSGQAVLCSFGRGATDAQADGADAARDVTALAGTMLAAGTTTGGTKPALARAARGGTDGPSARRLATLLTAPSAPPRRRLPSARPATLAAAAGVVLAVVLVTVLLARRPGARHPSSQAAGAPAACPAVDRGCRPLPTTGGVIDTSAGRYRIGRPGDLVVVGRWRCRSALPALLRPATGDVWVWSTWATGAGPRAAHLVGRVPGARSLQVDPSPAGCDLLRVLRQDGESVVIRAGDAS